MTSLRRFGLLPAILMIQSCCPIQWPVPVPEAGYLVAGELVPIRASFDLPLSDPQGCRSMALSQFLADPSSCPQLASLRAFLKQRAAAIEPVAAESFDINPRLWDFMRALADPATIDVADFPAKATTLSPDVRKRETWRVIDSSHELTSETRRSRALSYCGFWWAFMRSDGKQPPTRYPSRLIVFAEFDERVDKSDRARWKAGRPPC